MYLCLIDAYNTKKVKSKSQTWKESLRSGGKAVLKEMCLNLRLKRDDLYFKLKYGAL